MDKIFYYNKKLNLEIKRTVKIIEYDMAPNKNLISTIKHFNVYLL